MLASGLRARRASCPASVLRRPSGRMPVGRAGRRPASPAGAAADVLGRAQPFSPMVESRQGKVRMSEPHPSPHGDHPRNCNGLEQNLAKLAKGRSYGGTQLTSGVSRPDACHSRNWSSSRPLRPSVPNSFSRLGSSGWTRDGHGVGCDFTRGTSFVANASEVQVVCLTFFQAAFILLPTVQNCLIYVKTNLCRAGRHGVSGEVRFSASDCSWLVMARRQSATPPRCERLPSPANKHPAHPSALATPGFSHHF